MWHCAEFDNLIERKEYVAFRFWLHLEDIKEWREGEVEEVTAQLKKEAPTDAITRQHTIKVICLLPISSMGSTMTLRLSSKIGGVEE